MRRECRERFSRHRIQRTPLVSDPVMHHGTCARHMSWCLSGSLNSRWQGKRSLRYWRMCNPQIYVSGSRSVGHHFGTCSLRPDHKMSQRWWVRFHLSGAVAYGPTTATADVCHPRLYVSTTAVDPPWLVFSRECYFTNLVSNVLTHRCLHISNNYRTIYMKWVFLPQHLIVLTFLYNWHYFTVKY